MERISGIEIISLDDLMAQHIPEPRWIVEGIVPAAAFTLLVGYAKSGKSTMAYSFVASMLRGEPFAGLATEKTGVLTIALEESKGLLKNRLKHFDIPAGSNFHIINEHRNISVVASSPFWQQLAVYCVKNDVGLVVIDTLARATHHAVEDENDNAALTRATQPIVEFCRTTNATVVAIHHSGKLEGMDPLRDVRGASSIVGQADHIITMRKGKKDPHHRELFVTSRFEQPFDRVMLGYENHRWEKAASGYSLNEDAILAALREAGEPIDATGLLLSVGRGNVRSVVKLCSDLEKAGKVIKSGKGVKGDPILYRLAQTDQ